MKLAKSRVFRVGRPARQLESPWELGTIDHPVISSHLTPWTNRRSSVLPKCFLRTHTHTEHTNTRNNLSYLSADDPSHTNKTEEKEQLKGGGIPEQSLVTLSPRTGGLRLRTHTHSQVSPRRIEELRLLRAISRIS